MLQNSWLVSNQCFRFTDFGDSIDDNAMILFGINTIIYSDCVSTPMQITHPPSTGVPISQHILMNYNNPKYSLIEYPKLSDKTIENDGFILNPIVKL